MTTSSMQLHNVSFPNLAPDCRLLILDDDPVVGQTIAGMAGRSGIPAVHVSRVEELHETIEQFRPSHIALDLMMPDMDGVAVMKWLAEAGCTASVIIISGAGSRILDAAHRSAKEHGLTVLGTLGKPFSGAALGTLLKLNNQETLPNKNPVASAKGDMIDAQSLANALESGEIAPSYQPIVSCADGSLLGFEALARWQRNGTFVCGPDVFVPLAEQNGQIERLTEVIVEQSFAWLHAHFSQSTHRLSINVSAHSLVGDSILDLILFHCDQHDISPARVVIEITESSAIGPGTEALDLLTRMRLKGMHLAIDDYGIGYSSLAQLARLPFSELKIDRQFIADLVHSTESRAIVKATIGMAEGLGLQTIAEGVEDLETFWLLRELGCDAAQGFFIGRPMFAERAVEWNDVV